MGELRRLAAGRRAKIGNAHPPHVAEKLGGKRRGGILYPPLSGGIAFKFLDRA